MTDNKANIISSSSSNNNINNNGINVNDPRTSYSVEDISNYYYVHDKKLGEGGFAKVRLATHLATQQQVAIKCLDKIKLGPELPRIYNEIECLKRLKHKNIARLYQVFETQTSIYLVLEYCAGRELFDYIVSKSKLEEPEAAQIIYDLMRVLDFIHINGFAHRDLKPENVLFDDKHQIKLIDFGLAANCSADNMANNKNQAPIDQLSTCCGSVTYAAPEVISGGVYSGTAVDVWSAGIMMYALLVGQLPFNDNSITKLYQKIQGGLKGLPSFLSHDASDLIREMLTVDPKRRITVREVLIHPWLRNRTIYHTRINRRLDFNSKELDEQLVQRCCEKFPHVPETRLREYIQRDFNYYSTTYHLLLARCPPRSFGVKRTPDRHCPVVVQANNQTNVSPVKRSRLVPVLNTPTRDDAKRSRFATVTTAPRSNNKRTLINIVANTGTPRSESKRSHLVTVTNTPRSETKRTLLEIVANTPRSESRRSRLVTLTNTPRSEKSSLRSVIRKKLKSLTKSSLTKKRIT